MLDREQVRRLIFEVGLAEHANVILDSVRSGYRLDLDRDADPAEPRVSKLGGDPDLTADEAWPLSRQGARLVFLAQIDLSTAPALPPEWPTTAEWPHTGGLVRVFANLLEIMGEPCAARILTAANGAVLARTAAPEITLPLSSDAVYFSDELVETDGQLPECAVRLVPFLTLPSSLAEIGEADERYWTLVGRLRADGSVRSSSDYEAFNHQLLGETIPVQDDPRAMGAYVAKETSAAEQVEIEVDASLQSADAWRVLLAIHDDSRIELGIGDAGAYFVLVPAEDLAMNRFDRVICDQESC